MFTYMDAKKERPSIAEVSKSIWKLFFSGAVITFIPYPKVSHFANILIGTIKTK